MKISNIKLEICKTRETNTEENIGLYFIYAFPVLAYENDGLV